MIQIACQTFVYLIYSKHDISESPHYSPVPSNQVTKTNRYCRYCHGYYREYHGYCRYCSGWHGYYIGYSHKTAWQPLDSYTICTVF